ncbi:MAG: PIN domain-containing protein [Acidimicrobiales bacterium]
MRLVVDTGVFSAALSARRRHRHDEYTSRLVGNQLFIAPVTVAELRYGSLVAGWGAARLERLEAAIGAVTVAPVTDRLLTTMAVLRVECRRVGHPLASPMHGNDLWIAAAAVHLGAAVLTADEIFDDVPGLVRA